MSINSPSQTNPPELTQAQISSLLDEASQMTAASSKLREEAKDYAKILDRYQARNRVIDILTFAIVITGTLVLITLIGFVLINELFFIHRPIFEVLISLVVLVGLMILVVGAVAIFSKFRDKHNQNLEKSAVDLARQYTENLTKACELDDYALEMKIKAKKLQD